MAEYNSNDRQASVNPRMLPLVDHSCWALNDAANAGTELECRGSTVRSVLVVIRPFTVACSKILHLAL